MVVQQREEPMGARRVHALKLIPAAAVIFAILCLSPGAAYGQSYPAKPVRVLVPWPPGGSNDIVGRVLAQRLSENLGQQFVVENRSGASSIIGCELVAKSAPDGYTFLVNSATHVANALLYKKLPFDPLKDFIGVTALARQVGILVVHPSLPARTAKEFVALARARPDQIIYAATGNGSFTHLTMALFNEMTKTRMLHVNYKGGGPAVIALASGETHAMIIGIASVIPQMKANRLRPLAVSSAERTTQFPEIPTLSESGVTDYELTAWIGSFVPAGTPRPIVEKLNAEIGKALDHPDVAKNLSNQTLDPMHMSSEQFAARLKSDYEKYDKVVRISGARLD
jgi:tripartite-type tricarboxylate transporter receptor subunit TctC